jgi:hypothetical protein
VLPEARLEFGGGVLEARLVDLADRIRLPEGRDGNDFDPIRPGQPFQGLLQRRFALTEIRPETNVCAHENSP